MGVSEHQVIRWPWPAVTAYVLIIIAAAPVAYVGLILLIPLKEIVAIGVGMLYAMPLGALVGMIGAAHGRRWGRWLLIATCAAGIGWVSPWHGVLRDIERYGSVNVSDAYRMLSLSWAAMLLLAAILLLFPSVGRWQSAVRRARSQRRAERALVAEDGESRLRPDGGRQ